MDPERPARPAPNPDQAAVGRGAATAENPQDRRGRITPEDTTDHLRRIEQEARQAPLPDASQVSNVLRALGYMGDPLLAQLAATPQEDRNTILSNLPETQRQRILGSLDLVDAMNLSRLIGNKALDAGLKLPNLGGEQDLSDEQREDRERSRYYGEALTGKLMEAKTFDDADAVIEGRLRAIEEDEQDIASQQQNLQTLTHVIDSVFSTRDEWRFPLAEKVHARTNLHLGNFTSRYIGGEALAGVVTNFQQRHWVNIFSTAGVRRMVEMQEEVDEKGIKGSYYRRTPVKEGSEVHQRLSVYFNKPGDTKSLRKMWLVDKQLQLLHEAKSAPNKLGFKYLDAAPDVAERIIALALRKVEETDPDTARSKSSYVALQEILKQAFDHQPGKTYDNGVTFTDDEREFLKKLVATDRQGNMRKSDLGNYVLESNKEIGAKGERFEWLIYELQRANRLAQRTHLTLTMSNSYDGPRWKKGVQTPQGYEVDGIKVEVLNRNANQESAALVELNPKLVFDFKPWRDGWIEPEDAGKIFAVNNGVIEMDLAHDPHLLNLTDSEKRERYGDPNNQTSAQRERQRLDEAKVAGLQWLRANKMHLIMITWEKAWRGFYKNNWDNLDFAASLSGNSGRESRKTTHFNLSLEKSGEDKPGIVRELRRFAHTGALSLDQLFAYESALNIVDNWDSNFPKVKGYAARLRGGDKLRNKLTGGEKPDLLNSAEALANPIEALKELKAQLKTYMSDSPEDQQEVNSIMRDWVEAIVWFQKNRIHDYFPQYKNADSLSLDNIIMAARGTDLIDDAAAKELARKYIGPDWWRFVAVNYKLLSVSGSLFEMLKKLVAAIITGK